MIPRYQKLLFAVLLVASLAMGAALWQLREHAHERLVAGQDSAPTRAPEVAPDEQATLLGANDSDGSLVAETHSLPLPANPDARAQAVLGKLLDLYAAPGAAHPVPGGASSVLQVFLLPASAGGEPPAAALEPARARPGAAAAGSPPADAQQAGPQTGPLLAVVNLSGSFANHHPSGIETEMLTVLSLCGTLHDSLPSVTQVRFLVDGQPRPTLAGHADLTRAYLVGDDAQTEGTEP